MGRGALKYRLLKKRMPLNVILSVTNRCPAHCLYCRFPQRKQKELSRDQIFSLIDQMVQAGTQRLGLWGGEPLLRNDIGQIIDYASGKGLYVTLDSNGFLIPEKIESLKKLGHIVIALDGDRIAHEANRGKGSFPKTMKGIEVASQHLNTWTITVLTKHNLGAIDFILKTAERYGLMSTFQILHHNEKLGRNLKKLSPSPGDLQKAIRKLLHLKREGARIASSTNYLKYLLRWPDYQRPISRDRNYGLPCLAGKLYCNVDSDGRVYRCSLLIEESPALNFLEVGFRNAFLDLENIPCEACAASCFTEYNYLFALNPKVVYQWLKAFSRTSR